MTHASGQRIEVMLVDPDDPARDIEIFVYPAHPPHDPCGDGACGCAGRSMLLTDQLGRGLLDQLHTFYDQGIQTVKTYEPR